MLTVENLTLHYGGSQILHDISFQSDVGQVTCVMGTNGVGKTTLLKLLLKETAPDRGEVTHGTNLLPAVFDQTRAQLEPDMSLWESLTGDIDMRVSGWAMRISAPLAI